MKKHRLAARRLVAGVAAVVALGLVAAGCGGDSSDDDNPGKGASGDLRVLLNAQPATLDPFVGSRSGQVVWGTVIEPLVATDENLDPAETGIITSWTRDDPTTWTFKMRPGLTFTNGEKADAAAVAETLLTTRDAEGSILKGYFANMTSAEATDDTTIVVKTKLPQYDIPNLLCTVYFVPPAYYKEKGSAGFAAAPIGTGPYTFASSQAGRDIVVKKNPDYWGDKAANDQITFTWSTEAAQRLALLQSKSVDIALDLPPAQAEAAKDDGLNVASSDSAIKITAFLQSDKAPLDDPELREAIALAIDRDAIVDGVLDGKAKPDGGLLNVKPGDAAKDIVSPDPEKAKELVGSSSPEVSIAYPAAQYTNIEEVAQAMGGQLEEAGIKVKYNPLDYGTLVKEILGRQLDGIYLLGGVPNVAVPDFFASAYIKSESITDNCADPATDEMVSEALQQDSPEASQPIYDELNKIVVVDKHCFVPLYFQIYNYGTVPGVDGVVYSPLNAWDFSKTTVG